MDDFDRVAAPLERMSLLAQLRDLVALAAAATRPKCGDCQHWMKSRICPKEHNVNGHSRGPSCGDTPCEKYSLEPRSAEIGWAKCQEAIDFATEHGLPIPDYLEKAGG